jgi:secondary thiamine-phosphate synthase enzyme
MRQAATILTVQPLQAGLREITQEVLAWTTDQGVGTGLLTLFCRHTSASLLIQENASGAVREDLAAFFEGLAPEAPGRYRHDDEGPDDMPAHIRAALTAASLTLPVLSGRPALGVWQGIFLFEHRRRPPPREIALHLLGEEGQGPIGRRP